jgi:hypothetical protein
MDIPNTQPTGVCNDEVDPVFVSFLENGHRQPSLTVLLAIERVLGLSPGELAHRTSRRLEQSIADAKRRGSRQAAKSVTKSRRGSSESDK